MSIGFIEKVLVSVFPPKKNRAASSYRETARILLGQGHYAQKTYSSQYRTFTSVTITPQSVIPLAKKVPLLMEARFLTIPAITPKNRKYVFFGSLGDAFQNWASM